MGLLHGIGARFVTLISVRILNCMLEHGEDWHISAASQREDVLPRAFTREVERTALASTPRLGVTSLHHPRAARANFGLNPTTPKINPWTRWREGAETNSLHLSLANARSSAVRPAMFFTKTSTLMVKRSWTRGHCCHSRAGCKLVSK